MPHYNVAVTQERGLDIITKHTLIITFPISSDINISIPFN